MMVKMGKRRSKRRGQSVLEYAIMFAAVVIVIVAVQLYFKRAVQGRWKSSADQIGEQFTTNRYYVVETRQAASRKEQTGGGLVNSGKWQESRALSAVDSNIDASYQKLSNWYRGGEVQSTDYVNAAVGGTAAVGAHSVFDSGRMANTSLFDDQ